MTDVPSLGGTQIMGTVGINYMPAIASSMKCVAALEAVNAALRNTQAAAKQHGAVFANDLAKQVSNQGIIYDRYGGVLSQVGAKTKTVTQEVKKHSKSVKELANSHSFLQHRFGWFASSVGFFGAINTSKLIVKTIGDVEMGMVELARISDDVTADFKQMRTELLQLGIDYGRSWTDTQDIALRWAQAGYSVADTLELTKTSLLALNTAELDAANATQSMIGIMAQWNLEAKDLLPVIDKINKTADDYSVSSQDLVDGLLRSSGAAKVMGMSLEENIAVLTAMREATGRTGREIGNAWNSILSYMQRDSAIKVFKSLEIPMFTDQTETQFRPVMQIFTELSQKWGTASNEIKDGFVAAAQEAGLFSEELAIATVGTEGLAEITETANKATQDYMNTLTDVEKRDAAQAASGIYRRNYLIALIERFAMTQEVLNNMMDASGYSMRENDRTMQAMESKVQQLKTAFTMLATEIGEAGLLEISKAAVDKTRSLVEGFEKLPPALKKIIINLSGTAAAFGVVNLAAKTFYSIDLAKKLMDIERGTKAVTTATVAYTGVTGGATLATNGFALSLHGLTTAFMRLPIVGQIAILAVLAETIHSLTKSTKDTTKETAELMKQHSESANKAKGLADEIERLSRKYESLTKAEEDSTEKSDELKKVTKQLTDLVPSAITGFDEMGNAITNIGTASEEARKKVAELRKEIEMHLQAKASLAQFELPQLEAKLKEAERIRDNIKSKVEIGNVQGILLGGKDTGATGRDQLKWFLNLTDDMEERARAGKLYSKAIEDAAEAIKKVEDARRAIKEWEAFQAGTSTTTTTTTTTSGGGGLKETAAQAYERLNEERAKLNHQMKIGEISTAQYLSALQRIERDMRAAGVEEKKIWAIQEEIASLSDKSSKEYQKLLKEREREIEKQASEYRQFYDTAFNDAMSYYRHVNSLARSSRDEQIQYLKDLSRAHEWEKSKMWTLEEEIFRLYQSELKDQQQEFENAYNARIKVIEHERDLKIQSIQEQLDALDKEKQGDGRTEAERQHNLKMADLLKQKQYHELRTGAEHKKAIVDIERQMQEESRDWQRQIDDWRREDRKEVLQQQIEDIKKKADEEKEIWKQKYDEIKANWDKWADNFAEAAINDPRWLNIGKIIGGQLANGFAGSIEDIDRRIANVGDTVSGLKGSSGYGSGSPAGHDILNPNYQYLEQTWAGGAKAYIEAQQKRYTQAKISRDYDLMQRLEADARRVGYPLAHIGARVQSTGWAKLKHDERVLSPQLNFQFERLVAAMQTNRISSTGAQARGNITFNAPLFNAQKVEFEDSQDMEIFGREMKRHIESIRG